MRGWRRRDGFTQDIRVEMSLLSMLQRQGLRDPTILAPQTVVDFAVCDSAEILERPGRWRTGRIALGKDYAEPERSPRARAASISTSANV